MATTLRCPLCATEFDAEGLGCRSACPLSQGCHVTCCPNCHYSFPREDKGLAGVLRRLVTLRRERT